MPQQDTPTQTSDTPALSVSVVVHDSKLIHLRRTFVSLASSLADAIAGGSIASAEVCVLDNSCLPVFGEQIRRLLAELPFLQRVSWVYQPLQQNQGFGAAHNEALLGTTSDFHLVLNPDVELERAAVARAVTTMQEYPNAIALNPRAQGSNGEPQFLCKAYPSVLVLFLRAFVPAGAQRWFRRQTHTYELRSQLGTSNPMEVLLLSGCFMLLSGAAARRAGGFDTGYFLYFEDFDLSLRLRRSGVLLYAPQVEIVHFGGEAARKGWRHRYWFVRSAVRFFTTHGWRWW